MRTLIFGLSGAAALVSAAFYPAILLAITSLNFVAHILVMGLQLIVSRFPTRSPQAASTVAEEPFVSIHVPTHNEPPEVVLQTLQSLSQLKWTNYEVLVIDNNTTDPEIWKPVEAYCSVLGPRFQFFHVEGLAGFKAGAMNYVRHFMDPRAAFIFVVDADYVVDRKALRTAVRYFTSEEIGLIQFPQEYRNISGANRGLALDYRHYFSGFMNVANALECVPSTGTLALINVQALQKIGGFDSQFVTEDAELGFKLALNGYRSIYVNRVIGAGLIPHELDGLKKQRWRWAFGNAQILRRQWKELLFSPALDWKQRLGFISHLTAWINFNLIPSLTLILVALYSLFGNHQVEHIYSAVISGFTLVSYLFLKYGVLHYSLRRDGHSFGDVWRAFGSHLALSLIFSASWLRCLANSSAPFVRTNKFLSHAVPGVLRSISGEVALGLGLMASGVILALADFVIAPIAALAMCGAGFGIFWISAQTKHSVEATARLFGQLEAGDRPLET